MIPTSGTFTTVSKQHFYNFTIINVSWIIIESIDIANYGEIAAYAQLSSIENWSVEQRCIFPTEYMYSVLKEATACIEYFLFLFNFPRAS